MRVRTHLRFFSRGVTDPAAVYAEYKFSLYGEGIVFVWPLLLAFLFLVSVWGYFKGFRCAKLIRIALH